MKRLDDLEEYLPEVIQLLSEKEEQDVLLDHVIHEELVLEESRNQVVATISIPPPIQAVIIACRNLHHDQITFKMCGIQNTPEARKLELKQQILKGIVENWLKEMIAGNKEVRDAIEGKHWAPHVGNFWKMLLIERLPKSTIQ